MKTRFNTYDIVCTVAELQKLVGLRVNQIYDIDNRTYLIRLQQGETKHVLLLESGIRFHTTGFEWPKNVAPSGFTMKLRKHLKNKRLEKLEQFGIDRIVCMQFGSGEAAYHVILELYDRGNIVLTDHQMITLNILRPHVEDEVVRFAVREKYPVDRAKEYAGLIKEEDVKIVIANAKPGDNLRRIFTPITDCGPSVLDHVLVKYNLADCKIGGSEVQTHDEENKEGEAPTKGKKGRKQRKGQMDSKNARSFDVEKDMPNLISAFKEADEMLLAALRAPNPKGYIIQKKEEKPSEKDGEENFFYHNIEYHPYLFEQNKNQPFKEFESFVAAVDEFYSTLEGQKIDLKAMQQERDALKKLSNVKKDHEKRLEELTKVQMVDKQKAELITRNQALVDNAILAIQRVIASQMSWPDIHELVKTAQANDDPIAKAIRQLKLEINHISLYLHDPYKTFDPTEDSDDDSEDLPSMAVDVDLALSAFANARRYYDQKRFAAKKEQRTIDASEKALKSAEKKTQQTLKEVRTITSISKARKVYWFEKFYWFISSENYLVIGGRDSQQNELIVKRYMRPTDIYVHAEIQGASSVVIRNPGGGEVPPKTLLEAGTMAISYSVAWDAKVVTNAYWVKSEQVSKTAPTGEYLGTGSFMIRGKKNFLPPCHLIMGLSLLFKLEESSVERHKGERRVRIFEEDINVKLNQIVEENDKEIDLNDSDNEEKEGTEDNPNDNGSDSDASDKFPDIQFKIEHTGKGSVSSEPKIDPLEPILQKQISESLEEEKVYMIPALPPRSKQQQSGKKKKEEKQKKKQQQHKEQGEQAQNNDGKIKSNQVKRGQKGKLKKIKEKYKDQDEEERQMRMEILKSAGRKDTKDESVDVDEVIQHKKNTKKQFEPKKPQEEVEDPDNLPEGADVDMLDSLTGCPVDEDELLFAIPIVAPYQSLQNNKFKVKLTPGTGKRGKAAKTALLMFGKDKSCSPREKDLLKGVKDEALARNIPGKVKLSAPQLQKYKK